MRWQITEPSDGKAHTVDVEPGRDAGTFRVRIDEGPFRDVAAASTRAGTWSLRIGAHVHELVVDPRPGGTVVVSQRGRVRELHVVDPRKAALQTAAGAGGNELRASMPGRVVRVLVAVGQDVKAGEPCVVVEAMKMENELKVGRDAKVLRVRVKDGEVVEAGAVLVELQ